ERAGKRHQRGVAGAAADIIGVEFFAGGADVVDDDAVTARLHLGVDQPGQIDEAENLELPGVTPVRLVDLVDRAAGNIAGIVNENVDVGRIAGEAGKVVRFAQVDRMCAGLDAVFGAQLFRQRLERVRVAGGKIDVTAFFRKSLRGCRADALRC